jgi:hypothetical protein
MNIQIPTINTLFTFSECRPAKSYHKREQYLGDFLATDKQHVIDNVITDNAEHECDFCIPTYNNHVHKIDDETYQIHIWNKEIRYPIPEPDRIIDVKVEHVLSFMGRHFKLGTEVEVND